MFLYSIYGNIYINSEWFIVALNLHTMVRGNGDKKICG